MEMLRELFEVVTNSAGGVGNYYFVSIALAVALLLAVLFFREFLCWFLKISAVSDRLKRLEARVEETTKDSHLVREILEQALRPPRSVAKSQLNSETDSPNGESHDSSENAAALKDEEAGEEVDTIATETTDSESPDTETDESAKQEEAGERPL